MRNISCLATGPVRGCYRSEGGEAPRIDNTRTPHVNYTPHKIHIRPRITAVSQIRATIRPKI